jgi:glycosyltransferase involved in cell wall biosynthesis
MKVLWFSNTPANADEYFNSELKGKGNWLKSLDQFLKFHVDLHVAFYEKFDKFFEHEGTHYYPINPDRSNVKKFLTRFNYQITDKEDLSKYLEIINRIKPDIIHIHGTEAPYICIIPYTNIPVVVSIQGNLTVIMHKYFSGIEKHYLKEKIRKMNKLSDFLFPQSFYFGYKLFEKNQLREIRDLKFVNYVMGRTAWDRRITRILAPNSKYFHEDRILRPLFYNEKWAPHSRDRIIIFSTIDNVFYKGFETMCMSLNNLLSLGINYEWHVAGIDWDDLIVKIVKKKLKNNYPSRGLVLLGKLKEKTLIENLKSSDIYVMTSHIENNANSLCEAMILGMPCISTFVGGIGSLLKDGEEGLLIQNGDPWAMAGAILEMTNNKERAIKLGENARKVALKRHDKERIVLDLVKSYEEVIKSSTLCKNN